MQHFHRSQFQDVRHLARLKNAASLKISVCIPTLNEAETIGEIVRSIRHELIEYISLVDEVLVIDSGSDDATRALASEAGAKVFLAAEIAPELGAQRGKGENLWKALHVAEGGIICYIDGDIVNFHPGFITGLVGPLLTDDSIDYVKAYYERPLDRGESTLASGGGRVSEILIRPLLSLFYPELAPILQPLAGEYAARRNLLEMLAFPTGYGVEIAHLIDLLEMGKLANLAQTDLVKRIHRNRDDGELGQMAFALLRVVLRRLERDGKLTLAAALPDLYQTWIMEGTGIQRIAHLIAEPERSPLRSFSQTKAEVADHTDQRPTSESSHLRLSPP